MLTSSLTEAAKMAILRFWLAIGLLGIAMSGGMAQDRTAPKRQIERAKRPTFSERDWDGIYFEDLFREGLVGTRPENLGQANPTPNAAVAVADPSSGDTAPTGRWSELISGQAIEDEIKKTQLELDGLITTAQNFKTENTKVRQALLMLSTMFAIVAEYDESVRWKADAAAARDAFAQAAANAQTSSDEAFANARARRDQLAEMIRGGKLADESVAGSSTEMDWAHWADRVALMKRLDASYETRLKPWTSNASEFSGHADEVLHEANIVAAVARVLTQAGLDEADDEEYAKFAGEMLAAAKALQAALQANNFDAASSATNQMGQSCSNCHETYR